MVSLHLQSKKHLIINGRHIRFSSFSRIHVAQFLLSTILFTVQKKKDFTFYTRKTKAVRHDILIICEQVISYNLIYFK